MNLIIDGNLKRFAPLYILQILEEHTSEENAITYEDICRKLEANNFSMERKAVARYAEDLMSVGYKIGGIEYDDNGEKIKSKKGIWLEKDFSDENLQMLIDSVLFSKYISQNEAKELIGKIKDMGSATFQEKNKGIAKLSSVYHAHEVNFFKELGVIQQAISQEKKLSISHGNYKESNGKFILEGKNKIIHPYHLAFSNGRYYLIAYAEDREKIEHFRVDKIRNAKRLDQPVKPIRDTQLKGIALGDYLMSHPFLFTGDVISVTFKVQSNKIGHVIDTFGETPVYRGSDKRTTTFSVRCNEEDMYYWALQFGSCVEVLEPQRLRERLRVAVEEMAMRYQNGNADRYNEALRQFEYRNGVLELKGIVLNKYTRHHKLNVKHLWLSDNQLTDVSFLKNYKKMSAVYLYNNPITDLSPLADCAELTQVHIKNLKITNLSALLGMQNLRCLELENCENVDASAIYQMGNLEELRIHGSVKNFDVEAFKKQRPKVHIQVYEKRERTDFVKSICSQYPLNVLREAIGYNYVFVGDEEEATKAVDEMLLRLPYEERAVAELVFKDDLGEKQIAEILDISTDEIARRVKSYKKKITHESYNKGLEKFLQIRDPNSTNGFQKLWDMVGISDEKRK